MKLHFKHGSEGSAPTPGQEIDKLEHIFAQTARSTVAHLLGRGRMTAQPWQLRVSMNRVG